MGVGPSHAVDLAQRLIRCPSVTPHEGGALDLLEAELTALGFACTHLPFGEGDERIDNLFARIGDGGPHLCFAGHTDVVPVGDEAAWTQCFPSHPSTVHQSTQVAICIGLCGRGDFRRNG